LENATRNEDEEKANSESEWQMENARSASRKLVKEELEVTRRTRKWRKQWMEKGIPMWSQDVKEGQIVGIALARCDYWHSMSWAILVYCGCRWIQQSPQ
jgi:hypothetical protein